MKSLVIDLSTFTLGLSYSVMKDGNVLMAGTLVMDRIVENVNDIISKYEVEKVFMVGSGGAMPSHLFDKIKSDNKNATVKFITV